MHYYELNYFRGRRDTGFIYIKTEIDINSIAFIDEDDFLECLAFNGLIEEEAIKEIVSVNEITEEEYNDMTGGK